MSALVLGLRLGIKSRLFRSPSPLVRRDIGPLDAEFGHGLLAYVDERVTWEGLATLLPSVPLARCLGTGAVLGREVAGAPPHLLHPRVQSWRSCY